MLDPIRLALAQARLATGLTDPNPRVGCVLTTPDGRLLAQGHTQQAGGPHAEVVALRAARDAGLDVRGATAWVTLEPCAHHGRTPPCCDALVHAGVSRVVVALRDPNPLVGGQGIERLRAAGIEVEVLPSDHPAAVEARELNIGFLSRMVRGLPWVRMKIAASLDGRTALDSGESQWITGPGARADGHAWRRRASAVLTGIGTVLEDDPRLDVRLVDTPRQPLRVIVDSQLQTPPQARILPGPGAVLIYAAQDDAARRAALEAAGAEVALLPGPGGKVDLAAMLRDLGRRGVNELHVEAGHKLNGSFVREGLVDEFLVYLAPKLVGQGREMMRFGPLGSLADAVELEFTGIDRVGPDLRVLARVAGRARF
ncbi:bifunctional diaminohydroxyphosphoribosylaminopyrimidine deaminase/5-amino-6-(5-phosphoribosylamino)uracil reductase RibD [Caldimonas tepidiphila]|uniref:bifunctional diaminohydroxyphosphoribosylaminopyrimidine deaminase/5-amino-6-(5-phosphoribosylamino)uracil reductase RibD n=1 Tax=Caldimonas tepidiphila TaxID=2315841 RepID=UPI001F0BAFF4|nr:bifunctional diaminohydroxyphosphoribosylaminopyrimidine deaminase/5-amino-6-(5-phosphoribosylamino)uracil reductase RibD [Caldimonas tepidiphila]